MTKKDMIDSLAEKTGMTKVKAEETLEFLFGKIGDSLVTDNRVVIPGLGSLQLHKRTARQGRNPATGKPMDIPAKTVVKFKTAKALADKLN